MVSPSRVPFAATVFPCMPPRTNLPHIQVGQGQEFQLEWSTGHDRNVYFVLIRKNHSDWLAQNRERDLDTYITGSTNLINSHWTKKHRTKRTGSQTHALGGTVASHYGPQLMPGQTEYIARPVQFGEAMNLYPYVSTPNDAYVSYSNSRWPWIVSVWRFEIQEADPNEWDVAWFKIPNSVTANGGDFIIHYLWSGYYDCIDINVLQQSNPTTWPYGKPINGSDSIRANRIDHCIFDRPLQYTSWPRPVISTARGAALGCIEKCKYWYEQAGCGGVTVFPLSLMNRNDFGSHWNSANNILTAFYDVAWKPYEHFSDGLWNVEEGIPYDFIGDVPQQFWRMYRPATFGQEYYGVQTYPFTTLRTYQGQGSDPWTCVLTNPRTPTTTSDKMTVTDDPLDPIFYSTCWEVVEVLEFIGYSLNENAFSGDIPYAYTGGSCISCDDAKAWSDESYAPAWQIVSKCSYCERDFPNVNGRSRVPVLSKKTLQAGLGWNGVTNGDDCQIWFNPGDANTAYHPFYSSTNSANGYLWPEEQFYDWTPELCASTIRARSSTCRSDVMLWRAGEPHNYPEYSWWAGCGCVKTASQCSTSSMTVTFASWQSNKDSRVTVWDLNQVAPDPTCATGVKNTAGTFCCKGPCWPYNGAPAQECTDDTGRGWISGQGAFCQTYNIPTDRLCSQWGPPCKMG
jgi:hypothetical protein